TDDKGGEGGASHNRRVAEHTLYIDRKDGSESNQRHPCEQRSNVACCDQAPRPELDRDDRLRGAPLLKQEKTAGDNEESRQPRERPGRCSCFCEKNQKRDDRD